MKKITFLVPESVAERMSSRSVYLDVFGVVRWTADSSYVDGSDRWSIGEADPL